MDAVHACGLAVGVVLVVGLLAVVFSCMVVSGRISQREEGWPRQDQ